MGNSVSNHDRIYATILLDWASLEGSVQKTSFHSLWLATIAYDVYCFRLAYHLVT